MKWDFCIGNPPYQNDRHGDSNTAIPVYHDFIDAAYAVADTVELITPARFLFNAGRTPKNWNDKMLHDQHFKVLDYEKDATDIRKTLLLYNVAYLEACNENGRFPFEKYKDEKVFWDLEHINAVSDSRPDDDRRDYEDNNRLQWLKKTKDIPEIEKIQTADGQPVESLVKTIIDNKLYLAKNQANSKDFIQVYEAVINYYGGTGEADNSIANLTLLDCGTNRSYKNDVFPLKRKTILERTMSDVFIP